MDLFTQYTVDSPDRLSLQLLLALGGLVVIVGGAALGTFIFSKTGLKKVSKENRSDSLTICYFLLSFSLVVCFVAGTTGYLHRLDRDHSLQVAEDNLSAAGVEGVGYDWDSATYVGTFEGEAFLGKKIELPNGEFGIVRVKDKDATVVAVK